MRIPVPKNRLVAFTLVGALLTAVVAGGLAFPDAVGSVSLTDDLGQAPFEKLAGNAESGGAQSSEQGAATQTTPQPNEDFTPAVQTRVQSGDGGTQAPSGDGGATASAAQPTPNPNFTPSVQTQASSGYHEEGEYGEHEEEEHGEYEEHEEDED